MKTYTSWIKENGFSQKVACMALDKAEAAKKMNIPEYKVLLANCHLDFVTNAIKY